MVESQMRGNKHDEWFTFVIVSTGFEWAGHNQRGILAGWKSKRHLKKAVVLYIQAVYGIPRGRVLGTITNLCRYLKSEVAALMLLKIILLGVDDWLTEEVKAMCSTFKSSFRSFDELIESLLDRLTPHYCETLQKAYQQGHKFFDSRADDSVPATDVAAILAVREAFNEYKGGDLP